MSNHSGSYLVNNVLKKLESDSVFEALGRERTQQLVIDIVQITLDWDCNKYEVLEDIGLRLGICDACLKPQTDLTDRTCASCKEELQL